MRSVARHRRPLNPLLPLVVIALAGCGDDSAPGGSGAGGSAPGGADQGGQGGVVSGGSAQGGSAQGGSAQGGSAQGGSAQGGSAQGGNAQGGGGQGGGSGCTEITANAFALVASDGTAAAYAATPAPDAGAAEADALFIEFYGSGFDPVLDGEATGTFDLSMGGDANYGTCSRCVRLGQDPSVPGKIFFQTSGTLAIDAASDQLNGVVDATLTDVTLIEVTIDPSTFTSTPVPNGECLHLTAAPVQIGGGPLTIPGVCQDSCTYLVSCLAGDLTSCLDACGTDLTDCSQAQLGELDTCTQTFNADCVDLNPYVDCVTAITCVGN